jgi:hypothetical protein
MHPMNTISERGNAENVFKSYQKQENQLTLSKSKKEKIGISKKAARTTANNTSKNSKEDGPIQEMPTVQERKLEISIDDAIGTLRCVPYVNNNCAIQGIERA